MTASRKSRAYACKAKHSEYRVYVWAGCSQGDYLWEIKSAERKICVGNAWGGSSKPTAREFAAFAREEGIKAGTTVVVFGSCDRPLRVTV